MQLSLALAPLEKAINQAIQFNPEYQADLNQLAGKAVSITIVGVGIRFYIVFSETQVYLYSESPSALDLSLSAPPFSLLKLFCQKEANEVLQSASVEVEGDVLVAQQVKQLFNRIEIDWEYYLGLLTGEVVAHESKRFVHNNIERTKRFFSQLQGDASDYVQEELQLLPSQNLVEDFFDDVDTFRNDVARLKQRITKLENQLNEDQKHS